VSTSPADALRPPKPEIGGRGLSTPTRGVSPPVDVDSRPTTALAEPRRACVGVTLLRSSTGEAVDVDRRAYVAGKGGTAGGGVADDDNVPKREE
jgi:hypothetical protein